MPSSDRADDGPILWRDGRAILPHSYRDSAWGRPDGPAAPSNATFLLGGMAIGLAALVGAGGAPVAAAMGVAWFVGAGVAAGFERRALTVALALAALGWTTAGISVYLVGRTAVDPAVAGAALVGLGAIGVGVGLRFRGRTRTRPVTPR